MSTASHKIIDLDRLSDTVPVILPEMAGFYKCNCMYALKSHGHQSGALIKVKRNSDEQVFCITWIGSTSEQLQRSIGNDINKLVDFAACAIALPAIRELTGYVAYEQSALGTGFDYYLVSSDNNDDFIFNYAASLEVSGILAENEKNTVKDRINDKLRRFNRIGSKDSFPKYIFVVEFGQPWAQVETA